MPTRLIDVPFTRGIDESVDETVAALPAMTELVNYRLTRAGRLEHRLGVKEAPVSQQIVSSTGGKLDQNKVQGLYQRFVAAGGHGHTALPFGQWACNGSLSRFVPWESYAAIEASWVNYSSPTCTSVNGFMVVAARSDKSGLSTVNIYDELTGACVRGPLNAGSGNDVRARCVACGTLLVVVTQDNATGTISQETIDMSVVPLSGLSGFTGVAAAAVNTGFDAAPISTLTSAYLLSRYTGAAVLRLSTVDGATGVEVLGANVATAGAALSTCVANNGFYYVAWMDQGTNTIRAAVFNSLMVQVGATQTIANVAPTALSNNRFRPVLVANTSTSVLVGWTDSFVNGAFQTYKTTFRVLDNTATLGTTYGPIRGTFLASKPFRTSTTFVEGLTQPAVWLANHNPNVSEIDRSYFLVTVNTLTDSLFTWECSASPSGAVSIADTLSTVAQVPEVVQSTSLGEFWQTALMEAFRGIGTSTPQFRIQVYRFADAARRVRYRTRALVPAQGGLAVLGGVPRYFDGTWLNEIGISHGPTIISATPDVTGALTVGTYRYVLVLEYFDAKGQRCLSYASSPYTAVLTPGNNGFLMTVQLPTFWGFPNASSIADPRRAAVRMYRTSSGSGTVFRFTPPALVGYSNGYDAGPALTSEADFPDQTSDVAISANEAVYVQVGNALSNYRAPPCRFGCEHEGRLVVAGCWNQSEARVSKLFFPGEAIQFTESAAFVITNPEPITGVASLDGTLVLFSERAIYTVSGDGPLDDGSGSFTSPRRLPGRIGCIDWRSIATREDGVYFRAADGIYVLPRGLGSPQFVGAAIKEKLRQFPETLGVATATRAVSASVDDHDSEQVIAWLVGNAESPTEVAIYVLSLATNSWSEFEVPQSEGNPQVVIGVWRDIFNSSDALGFVRRDINSSVTGSILVENVASGYDQDIDASFEPLLNGGWKTGKIFPFGFGGRGSVRTIRIVGECLAATTLTATVYTDVNPAGDTQAPVLSLTPGRFAVEIPFRRHDLAWVQIQVADPTTGSGNRGAGVRFNGLALEVEMEGGLHRTTPSERSI